FRKRSMALLFALGFQELLADQDSVDYQPEADKERDNARDPNPTQDLGCASRDTRAADNSFHKNGKKDCRSQPDAAGDHTSLYLVRAFHIRCNSAQALQLRASLDVLRFGKKHLGNPGLAPVKFP